MSGEVARRRRLERGADIRVTFLLSAHSPYLPHRLPAGSAAGTMPRAGAAFLWAKGSVPEEWEPC